MDSQPVAYQGQRYLSLRDPLGLAAEAVLVPESLAPLLALCDGSRDVGTLRTGLMLRTGTQTTESTIADLIRQLDAALLLENGTFRRASAEALEEYRRADSRSPSHAGLVYPAEPDELGATLAGYCEAVEDVAGDSTRQGTLVGMVCPHIDYERGHETYAALWRRAEPLIRDVEVAVIFGTDHAGGPGALTLTRQSYRTPLGVMATDVPTVDAMAEALGPERAYAEEIHHIKEHSIELALVWLHYALGRSCLVVPVLCGSFQHFVAGEAEPDDDEAIAAALAALQQAVGRRRTLVIAAGDLAHMGPAYGNAAPVDALGRARLAAKDAESLEAVAKGDAAAFFSRSRTEGDARKLCGLPPIYLTLRYLDGAGGETLGYSQCAADAQGGSLVSIAGALLWESA